MRLAFGILLLLIVIALGVCARIARRSGKRFGFAAAGLLGPLIFPVFGNGLIIMSGNRIFSLIGCYFYYLGLDVSIAALIHFTYVYCGFSRHKVWDRYLAYPLLLVDVIQLLLNPFFHHAFKITEITVDGFPYYKMIPLLGQQFHRAVDYLLLAGVIAIFIYKMIRAPRLQAERYWIILFALLVVTVWQTAYIFSGTPIDRSMIGFGVFGLLIFYFSLYYRPMRLLDRMLSGAASDRKEPMYFFDMNAKCVWMNRAGAQLLNLDESQPEEENLEKAEKELMRQFGSIRADETEWHQQSAITVGGETRPIELTRQPIIDSEHKMDGFYLYIRDLTAEQQEAARKLYNARHDQLTGLYNRDYLYERTRELLQQNPDEPYLIISSEITDLKVINDLYGNAFGDQALLTAADWLRNHEHLNRGGIYGRLGGDSFGACIPEKDFDLYRMESELSALSVTEGETKYRMLIHVGIYKVLERDLEVALMYDRAVLALEHIKDDFHFHTAWYDESMRHIVIRNREISEELAPALEQGQIRPFLQPIINREGKVIGAEALVRWIHPEEGIRPPASFISMFEKNGMIADVDRYMWRKSCEILSRWQKEGKDLFISVNISTRDFYLLDVPTELTRLVQEFGVEPARLRLEITESMMMNDPEWQLGILRQLRHAGFIVEMDDFGSGYSSLNLLREMPVDVLKIDMVFLEEANRNSRARTIVEEIITMARRLGIASLIEGVETREQFDDLMKMGCVMYQGYYFSRPIPVDEFEQKFIGRDSVISGKT